MAARDAVPLVRDHASRPATRPGSDEEPRPSFLRRSITGLGLAAACWVLLIAFGPPASADGTTPAGASPSDAAASDVPAPASAVPQPKADTTPGPGGSPAAPGSEAAPASAGVVSPP